MKTILFLFLIGLIFCSVATSQSVYLNPVKVETSVYHDVSPPLRDMPAIPPLPRKFKGNKNEVPNLSVNVPWQNHGNFFEDQSEPDPVLQDWNGSGSFLNTIINMEGMGNLQSVAPPDPTGDIGPNHFIQAINVSFAIYSKTGTLVYGPVDLNTLFQGVGTNNVDGDPIVLYDQLADRWLISAFSAYPPYTEFIAVSQTSDPLGSWNRYAFLFSEMADYPKLGVWMDGYYMSVNMFNNGQDFMGPAAVAFERDSILAGKNARMITFQMDTSYLRLLPADMDGQQIPSGSPAIFATFADDAWAGGVDRLELFRLQANWNNPASSTFSGPEILPTAPFDSKFYNWYDKTITQKGTFQRLDALSQLFMNRLQYRKFSAHSSMVVNHTVDADNTNHAGIRWYELRNNGTNWSIYQQGTYAPDVNHRWNGSVAMDGLGNIAIGYSVSGVDLYPSICATGRRTFDPLNTLPIPENTIMAGIGSETVTNRWGDYSLMTVDPLDEETFWYTNEYYLSMTAWNWTTRIASFSIDNLVGNPEKDPVSFDDLTRFTIFPNPFSRNTEISWRLPEKGRVSVIILDLRGNMVTTLVNEEKPAGKHRVAFDATELSAGVYFCRLQVNGDCKTRKMILCR